MVYDDFSSVLQLGVFFRLAQAFWENRLVEKIDAVPIEIHPRRGRPILCCVSRDREVMRSRLLGALGLHIEDYPEEELSLVPAVQKALNRKDMEGPFLMVSDVACTSCIRNSYEITNACRNCVVRSCQTVCPMSAVQIVAGNRAQIDSEKCVSCGKCQGVCPFHAIVRIPIPCEDACPVQAIGKNEEGIVTIDWTRCIHCGQCMHACPFGAILEKSAFLDVLQALRGDHSVVALLAPSVIGQFPGDFSHLRQQLREMGFADVLEVALGAEVVLKEEEQEFLERMAEGEPFMTTSCCPAYIQLVEKHVPQLKPFVSRTRSPMRVVAEMARHSFPDAVTVFVGPCIAKHQEALHCKEVDFVLTFKELSAMLDACNTEPWAEDLPPLPPAQKASREGRQFAMSGGVSKAIEALAGAKASVKPVLVDGLNKKSVALLQSYAAKKCPGNFVEVMSCEGGCVAGPASIMRPNMSFKELNTFLRNSDSLKTTPK